MVDDVTESEKTRRIVALQATQKAIQEQILTALVGETHTILVDGVSRRRAHELAGRMSSNTIVNFEGGAALVGRLLQVRITDAGPNSVRGVLEPQEQPCKSN